MDLGTPQACRRCATAGPGRARAAFRSLSAAGTRAVSNCRLLTSGVKVRNALEGAKNFTSKRLSPLVNDLDAVVPCKVRRLADTDKLETKRKKRGISRDEAQAHTIRTQASRFIRKHKNFEALFHERLGSYRERFRRDAEWYAAAEKTYTARVEAFEKLREPFDWYAAMPLAAAAQLYHEQRKFAQARLYYRKAISAARRAVMNEDFRAFVLHWLRVEMKLCRHLVGIVPMPAYGGPRLPLQGTAGKS
jgi:hypothetical protein